jgi:hypothetical protein
MDNMWLALKLFLQKAYIRTLAPSGTTANEVLS